MSKVKIMSVNLANKISAGEVVESVASVVKELVENSIDAGSTNIVIELDNAGLNMISVMDNGCGMEHEDATTSFMRHATSKVLKEDDLFFIDTLGFRGEALPSIAAVSDIDMKTCATEVGTHIHIKGGETITDEVCDARRGTKIEVSNLFFNTPARLKYLKSEAYELANTTNFIEKISLSYPSIKFTLKNNDRVILSTSGSGDLKKTIHEIYGLSVSSKLLSVKKSNDDYDIYGYICKPEVLKSSNRHLITIVNGRVIRNNDINRAINDAYYMYKPDGKYPIVILNINTDPTLIDVNIHPTKQDIKLSKVGELYNLITKSIKEVLDNNILVSTVSRMSATSNVLEKEEVKNIIDSHLEKEEEENTQIELDFSVKESDIPYNFNSDKEDKTNKDSKKIKILINNLTPIGQINKTFIVAQGIDGLYLIDQHAAHERINYEKVLKYFQEEKLLTTDMLIPIVKELAPSEYIIVKENIDFLNTLGFKAEEFGFNTIRFISHPIWFREGFEEEGINRIVDLLISSGKNFDKIKFRDRAAAMLSCKMSIKANMDLSLDVMEHLLNDLAKCDNPYNCAHGRPTIINFTSYDLNRMFKRIMN